MASVDDVAAYILQERDDVMPLKLQLLLYYCEAWHLVCEQSSLFLEPIRASDHGPVVEGIGQQTASPEARLAAWPTGNASHLPAPSTALIDAVLAQYAAFTESQLRHLTREEAPWSEAWAAKRELITRASMRSYYERQLADTVDLEHAAKALREERFDFRVVAEELGL